MTNQLLAIAIAGSTLYAVLLDSIGQVWNGSTFEAPADANWTAYAIGMTEAGTTGIYRASMPVVAAGVYSFVVYRQAGANPAVGDTVIGVGEISWTGTEQESVPASANVTLWKGDAPADLDASGNVSAVLGAVGVYSKTYTMSIGGVPSDGWYCRMTTDAAGLANVDAGTTNAAGQVVFHHNLPVGTVVYIHRSKAGFTPDSPEPDVEVI